MSSRWRPLSACSSSRFPRLQATSVSAARLTRRRRTIRTSQPWRSMQAIRISLVAGWNDFVDWAPCPQADATEFGTCADPADDGVGLSAVAFSFDSGNTWIQPTYTGWTAADCDPTTTCSAHEGPIHTLPWYYENRLVSSGDPGGRRRADPRERPLLVGQRLARLLRQPHRCLAVRVRVPESGVPWLPGRRRFASRQPDAVERARARPAGRRR